MALLTRFFHVPDPEGNGTSGFGSTMEVFNFIVTKSVTRDCTKEVISKDFSYGGHKWAIQFVREDKSLGLYLLWRSPSEGLSITLDMTFTLMNREQFQESKSFSIKKATYQSSYQANGNRGFIKISELLTHRPRFVDSNGEFQVELKLAKIETFFERDIFFVRNVEEQLQHSQDESLAQTTNVFHFGAFSWTVTVKPFILLGDLSLAINVNRKFRTSTQTLFARLGYTVSVGSGEKRVSSERRDETIGPEETGQTWTPKGHLTDFYVRPLREGGLVRLHIDFHYIYPLTEYFCSIKDLYEDDLGGETAPVSGLDPDLGNWSMTADLHSNFLRFAYAYEDINKIPRNHLRFVQWRSFLVRHSKRWRGHRDEKQRIELVDFQSGNLFSKYYYHDDSDQGVMMETTISTTNIRDGKSEFLEDGHFVRVRIQWEYAHQLFQSILSTYDDIVRLHNIQMRSEISSLQDKVRRFELNQIRFHEELRRHAPVNKVCTRNLIDSVESDSSSTDGQMANKDRRTSSLNDEEIFHEPKASPRMNNLSSQHSLDAAADTTRPPRPSSLISSPLARKHHQPHSTGPHGLLGLGPPAPTAASTSLSTSALFVPAGQQPHGRSPSPRPPGPRARHRVLRREQTLQPQVCTGASSWNDIRESVLNNIHHHHPHPHAHPHQAQPHLQHPHLHPPPSQGLLRPDLEQSGPDSGHSGAGSTSSDRNISSLWASPTLRRVFAPLKQTLSASADNIQERL